jgi:hypothetical protein
MGLGRLRGSEGADVRLHLPRSDRRGAALDRGSETGTRKLEGQPASPCQTNQPPMTRMNIMLRRLISAR